MPKFIAVHTAPFTREQLKTSAQQHNLPEGFSWNLTYCAFDENKFFCEWDAPSKEALEQGFKQMNMPYDAVYPVKTFNVSKAEFE